VKNFVKERQSNSDVIMVIVIITCSVISIIADNKLNTINNISLNKLTSVLFAGLLAISSICFSCYFLLLQLYQNRYPMEMIKNDFLSIIRKIIIIMIYVVIFGSYILYLDSGFYIQLCFDLLAIYTIIRILIISYKSNKSLMINTYIDKYVENLKIQLDKSLYDFERSKDIFTTMRDVFEECYVKEEYFVCQNISKGIGQVFKSFIEQHNKMLLNEKMKTKDVDDFFLEIISYSIYQIELSKNCKSEFFVEDLINNNLQNILSCIRTQQFHLYKEYIKIINVLVYELQKNENEFLVNLIFKMYSRVSKELMTSNVDSEWLRYLYDNLYDMTVSLNYNNKNINIKYFAQLLTHSLLADLNYNENLHKYLFELLKKFSMESVKINYRFDEIIVYYAIYSHEIISSENLNAIKEFNELIFDIENDLISDSKCVDFIFYYLSSIDNKWENEFSDIVREKNVEILLRMISLDSTRDYYVMLPDFKNIVVKNKYDKNKIKSVCSNFDSLFNRAILKNNNSIFYLFSEKLNDCIITLEKDSRDIQELLFDVYINTIIRVSDINNKIFAEIMFDQLKKCVMEMDRNKKISSDFGDYIIRKITNVTIYTHKTEIVKNLVNLLRDFMYKSDNENEALNFILISNDKKILICRSIFNIGMDSIENNQEDSLRLVSDALGWLTIDSIKQKENSVVRYLLERSKDLFMTSKSLSISNKTLVFIMTLFTTVGTYCCKDPKVYKYRDIIIDALLDEEESIINTAIKLRISENDTWNELFDNKTKEYTNEFLQAYNSAKKKYINKIENQEKLCASCSFHEAAME
jgi:hypothetical protein